MGLYHQRTLYYDIQFKSCRQVRLLEIFVRQNTQREVAVYGNKSSNLFVTSTAAVAVVVSNCKEKKMKITERLERKNSNG